MNGAAVDLIDWNRAALRVLRLVHSSLFEFEYVKHCSLRYRRFQVKVLA